MALIAAKGCEFIAKWGEFIAIGCEFMVNRPHIRFSHTQSTVNYLVMKFRTLYKLASWPDLPESILSLLLHSFFYLPFFLQTPISLKIPTIIKNLLSGSCRTPLILHIEKDGCRIRRAVCEKSSIKVRKFDFYRFPCFQPPSMNFNSQTIRFRDLGPTWKLSAASFSSR